MSKFEGKNFDLRLLAYALMYRSLEVAGLAIATTAAKFKTTNANVIVNQGALVASAAKDNNEFSSGHTALNPDGDTAQRCKFLVQVAADGTTFSTTQGPIVLAAATPVAGPITDGLSPVGTIDVLTNAATTFTPGTTDLSAAGITDVYADLAFPYDGVDGLDITALAN